MATLREKLAAMAGQTEASPFEAEIASDKLRQLAGQSPPPPRRPTAVAAPGEHRRGFWTTSVTGSWELGTSTTVNVWVNVR